MASSHSIDEVLAALAWSLWAECGAPAWGRSHADHAVDPEALLLFTGALEDSEARLFDVAVGWGVRHGRLLSRPRLGRLLERHEDRWRSSFGPLAATINDFGGLSLPGATTARPNTSPGELPPIDLGRPALLPLRSRAVFGVTARAEIVTALLARPEQAWTAGELAGRAAFSKRSVADALDTLVLAGVVARTPDANRFRHRLARPEALAAWVGEAPLWLPRWPEVFVSLLGIRDLLARAETLDSRARAVEARAFIEREAADLDALPVAPPTRALGSAYWDAFAEWADAVVRDVADGSVPL